MAPQSPGAAIRPLGFAPTRARGLIGPVGNVLFASGIETAQLRSAPALTRFIRWTIRKWAGVNHRDRLVTRTDSVSHGESRAQPRGRRPAAAALIALLPLLAACGFDFFGEEPPNARLAESAARASLQTYAILQRSQRLAARELERSAEAAQPASAPSLQVAALPPSSDPGIVLRLSFAESRGSLSSESQGDLVALGAQLQREPGLPIKILAYWSADDDDAARAKLHALKRAMLVREFLADQGLARARIDFTRIEEANPPPWIVDVVVDRR